jgi:hypothetical protein
MHHLKFDGSRASLPFLCRRLLSTAWPETSRQPTAPRQLLISAASARTARSLTQVTTSRRRTLRPSLKRCSTSPALT